MVMQGTSLPSGNVNALVEFKINISELCAES